MSKARKISVDRIDITIIDQNSNDYISLTDMLKAKDGDFFITDWLRNRNTLEFLSIWESMNNPDFNYGEFAIIKNKSGLNSFKISVKEWTEKTNAIGIVAKAGRYGGTYAQKDIAFEFGTWINPAFKLYLIKEFQRLKDDESKLSNEAWDFRRFLTKVNYRIHTDSIKENILPTLNIQKEEERFIYTQEADILNYALFNLTAKQWKEKYPERVLNGHNIRDYADIHELTVLANLESYNSILIKEGLNPKDRLIKLRIEAIDQLKSLRRIISTYHVGSIESPFVIQEQIKIEQGKSEFNDTLGALMKVPKPEND